MPDVLHQSSAGLVCVSSVAVERLKDGTDLVNRIASTCFYHLRRLRQLKRHIEVEGMRQLIRSFIFSWFDYCNAVLIGLPIFTILQRVQNAAARPLLVLSRCDHVRSVLKELHWLPVVYRIRFKLALVMFTIHTPLPRLSRRFCAGAQQ